MSTLVNCNIKISELIHILKSETKALSKGHFEGLEETVSQKSARMMELESLTTSLKTRDEVDQIAPQMARLKRLANENGLMLRSVLNGYRSARERLRALQYQEANLGAYDRFGTNLYISSDQVSIKKIV